MSATRLANAPRAHLDVEKLEDRLTPSTYQFQTDWWVTDDGANYVAQPSTYTTPVSFDNSGGAATAGSTGGIGGGITSGSSASNPTVGNPTNPITVPGGGIYTSGSNLHISANAGANAAAPNPANPLTTVAANFNALWKQTQGLPADQQKTAVAAFNSGFGPNVDLSNLGNTGTQTTLVNVVKDANKNIVTGSFNDQINFKYTAPANAPANALTANYVVQVVHVVMQYQQGYAPQPIVLSTPTNEYFVEAFKIDATTNLSAILDSHGHTLISVGADSMPQGPNLIAPNSYKEQVDFTYGLGTYNNMQIPATSYNGNFAVLAKGQAQPFNVQDFQWLYGTTSYSVSFTLDDKGNWTLTDSSIGLNSSGVFNTLNKN